MLLEIQLRNSHTTNLIRNQILKHTDQIIMNFYYVQENNTIGKYQCNTDQDITSTTDKICENIN